MDKKKIFQNDNGFVLLGTYMMIFFILTLSSIALGKSIYEVRHVEREMNRLSSHFAAEAALQSALSQIGQNAYTGFINTAAINVANFQSSSGIAVGSFTANLSYPNQADWVVVTAQGTVNGETRNLEGRVFLDSNLSKYLVYTTGNFSSGTNAQYGYHDGVNPEGVSSNENDRAALYFNGDYNASGTNVQIYGDVHTQGNITGTGSSQIHGDGYASDFELDQNGNVVDDGINGAIVVTDGFTDDSDRDNDGSITSMDAPDHHDLTTLGEDDAHAIELLTGIDNNFYQTNNDTPYFAGVSAETRFVEFQASGTSTQIVEYSADWVAVINNYTLPESAIVYVNGDVHLRGEIEGRVSVVSTDDIYFDGNLTYTGNNSFADATHSTAFLAQDKIYIRPVDVEVSGILYAQNEDGGTALNGDYDLAGVYNPDSKARLRLFGNRILEGSSNTGVYDDRVYGYDENLKYYRPPGIPVQPELRMVREI